MAVLLSLTFPPPPISGERRLKNSIDGMLRRRHFFWKVEFTDNSSGYRIKSFQDDGAKSFEPTKSEVGQEDQNRASDFGFGNLENKTTSDGGSLLSKLGLVLGVAAVITLIAVCLEQPKLGSSVGIQYLVDGSSASALAAPVGAFSFQIFGYRIILPEYAPGWIYFWLLMAAGCGLFISEEALNTWVGISLARLLSLDGTWESFVGSLSRNAPFMISTVLWVYCGTIFSWSEKSYIFLGWCNGHITRVLLCRCLLRWIVNTSVTVRNWILTERASSFRPCNCSNCCGNLDSVPICNSCCDGTLPIYSQPLILQLVLLFFIDIIFSEWTVRHQTNACAVFSQSLVELIYRL
ncbi:uncharacterized protein [Primulina huaijiensis]|uniref:uncharacterized protein isoform X3 n=1 Tax=Primulina huaijiensis TaxID=1492673 RepID=UPI003CC75A94